MGEAEVEYLLGLQIYKPLDFGESILHFAFAGLPGTGKACKLGPKYLFIDLLAVRAWIDPETGSVDTHVAFFGEKWPSDGPSKERPYILRYAAVSLVLEPDADS